jgi:ribose/xylose/arabinose/galactoside ABC-type transport system permease subunit
LADRAAAITVSKIPRSGARSLLGLRELPALIFLTILVAGMSIFARNFGSSTNLFVIGQDMAITGIMAVGMTMIILTGGIDLSVASILTLAATVAGMMMMRGLGIPLAVLAGLCMGTACGFLNGALITWLRIPPIITTLGMMGILRASASLYTGGAYIGPLPMDFGFVGVKWTPVILLAVVAAGFTVFLSRMRLGRYIHAVGGNEEAVRLSGVRVGRVKLMIYTLNGLLAGLSGMILASSMSSVQSNMAKGYELNVIAAVVIGGTSITGGIGSVPGTIIGAGIMSLLYNALNLLGISKFWHQLIIGVVILAAVLMDRLRSER